MRALAGLLSLSVALAMGGRALAAQAGDRGDSRDGSSPWGVEAAAPDIRVGWEAAGEPGSGFLVVVRVTPPPGWSLYAPRDSSDTGDGGGPTLGLPLELRLPGGRLLVPGAVRPRAEERREAAGRTRIYRATVSMFLEPPVPVPDTLDVRWALCREDRCIPGRSRVSVPPPIGP